MFRRQTKKQMLIRRIIVSIVMVVAVLVIVTGAILFILGYRLDGDKGRLEQGALVQIETIPGSAYVSIDGKLLSSRTSTKQSVIAGLHSFIVTRDGYEPWAKSLNLKAGTLTWLDYIRLVPKNLKPETVATYPTLHGEKASPDLKTLIVQEKADVPTFKLVDLRSQDVKTSSITLSSDDYSDATTEGVAHSFTLGDWDTGGRFVLLTHTFGDKNEWIVVDTQNVAASVNVSSLLSISLTDLQFAGTNGSILYGLATDGVIRKLDLSAQTISRALVTNVKKFDMFETNVISYVGIDPKNSAHQVAGVYRDGDEAPHVLRVVKTLDTPLLIDATRYFSDDYVAIAEGVKVTILKGRYPTSSADETSSLKSFAEFTATAAVDQLQFNEEGDYLIARSGLASIAYEIEYQRQTASTIETTETVAKTLHWLDDAYLWAVYDGHLAIREFDGSNVHVINAAEPGFDATLSQNGRYLYSIGKSGTNYQLQRVKMILE